MNRCYRYSALLLACIALTAIADDRETYNRRSAERFEAMFAAADLNHDNIVSRDEAEGAIELVYRFDDIDITRDGFISRSEMTRFIDANFR